MIFTAPFLLLALAGLPLLWWLLRATPPAPRVQEFPAIRLLAGLRRTEETPSRTPLWLLLLRMLAAGLVIAGLAGPVLNADRGVLPGRGTVLLVVDDGWAAAADWPARLAAAGRVLDRAERAGRPVSLLATARDEADAAPRATAPMPAAELRPRLAALRPKPWPVDRAGAAAALAGQAAPGPAAGGTPGAAAGGMAGAAGVEGVGAVVYVADSVAVRGADAFDRALERAGPVTTLRRAVADARLMLAPRAEADRLVARVALLPQSGETRLAVLAEAGDGRALARAEGVAAAGAPVAEVAVSLPVELRNQLTRLVLEGPPAAAGVALLDERFRRRPVGLVTSGAAGGAGSETPLTGTLFYLDRALAPVSELRRGDLATLLGREVSVLVMADGVVGEADAKLLRPWIEKGGLLLRFAGPTLAAADAPDGSGAAGPGEDGPGEDRPGEDGPGEDGPGGAAQGAGAQEGVAQERGRAGRAVGGSGAPGAGAPGGDRLLPVALLAGDRQLGGAMSWSQPERLAPFPADSPFAGLAVPAEVTVTRQVLAEPGAALASHDWAQLADGTPLVTERTLGRGRIVLFHVTANAEWSNLPLSGLFVEMLERLVQLAGGVAPAADDTRLAPAETLDGFGVLGPPPAAATGLAGQDFATTPVSPRHPPGLYGPENDRRSLNLSTALGGMERAPGAVPPVPPGGVGDAAADDAGTGAAGAVLREAGRGPGTGLPLVSAGREVPLGPWLLSAATALLALDLVLGLRLRGLLWRAAACLVAATLLGAAPGRARAAAPAPGAALGAIALPAAPGDASAWHAEPGRAEPGTLGRVVPVQAATPAPRVTLFPGQTPIGAAPTQSPALATHLAYVLTDDAQIDDISLQGLTGLSAYVNGRTAAVLAEPLPVRPGTDDLSYYPLLYWPVTAQTVLEPAGARALNAYMAHGGIVVIDTRGGGEEGSGAGFAPGADAALRRVSAALQVPPLAPLDSGHVLSRSFYLLSDYPGRYAGATVWVSRDPSADNDGVSPVVVGANDWAAAWAVDGAGRPSFATVPGGNRQRTMAYRFGVNLVIYALTGNYKADQVHVPALLERLGQ